MALASTQVWEVRTTGNAANSGGFNSAAAGTDRSQQDAPHVDIDGVAITAVVQATTTDLAITGYVTSAADIGNTVNIAGGTMTAGTYEITAIPAAGQWRLDRSGGVAAQTGTGRMGGAGSDPALIAAVTVANNKIWQRAGTYTITSATPNIAGGCVSMPAGNQQWQGYQTVRGDLGTAPVLLASGINTATLFALAANDQLAINLEADGATLVALRGFGNAGRGVFYRCRGRRCTNSGIALGSQGSVAILCEALLCTTTGAGIFDASGGQGVLFYACSSHDNTVPGIVVNGASRAVNCLSYLNTGATSDGFQMVTGTDAINCVAYGNGRDGFRSQGIGNDVRHINCLAEGNAGIGFNGTGVSLIQLYNCGAFNNTGGDSVQTADTVYVVDFVTGTASFFANAAGGDFSLNTTVGGGAAVKQNALPGTFLDGVSVSYLDRGAVQTSGSPGAGGSGGGGAIMCVGAESWVM